MDNKSPTMESLAARLHSLEERMSKIDAAAAWGKWAVRGVQGLILAGLTIGTPIAILAAVFGAGWWLSALNSQVQDQGRAIESLEKASKSLEHSNVELTKLIVERFPRYQFTSLEVQHGRIVKLADAELTIETDEPEKRRISFTLTQDAKIIVNGRGAARGDLKPGMHVRVYVGQDGKASGVETIDPTSRGSPLYDGIKPLPAPPSSK